MKRRTFLLGTIAALPLLGCASSTGSLKGTVTLRKRFVRTGTVSAMSDDGNVGSCEITADGTYEIPSCPAGRVKVFVASPNPEVLKEVLGSIEAIQHSEATRAERHAAFGPTVAAPPPPPPKVDASIWFELPEQYSNPDTSGLTVEIDGATVFDIDMQ